VTATLIALGWVVAAILAAFLIGAIIDRRNREERP
jgi:hypothetical protein